ncbi:MAG TPA: 23S rRNA (adenine(2503)-C(2))-methyltransferase RlmN [Anaerolineales bacterium]|nr:23S rRNA (adenine(2503)-C(2))-methyltransferase RlmN [Anaerolineales bacterium]
MNLFDLDRQDFEDLFQNWKVPSYRVDQVWNGLYKNYWFQAKEFTNLPKDLSERLDSTFEAPIRQVLQTLRSSDRSTTKVLLELADGLAVETVLMTYDRRKTLCVSTQVGCAMGCTFCATGQMGFKRNLSSGEIIAQILYFERILHQNGERLTNIVYMGMGEPLHNYDNTLKSIDRLNQTDGWNFGARRFTLSTSGLVPRIRQLAVEKRQVNLAISLHSTLDEERSKIMPVNRSYPLAELIDACKYYLDQTHRRITFEWALIYGVNDTEEEARRLAKLLAGLLCHVNAIPLNPTSGFSGNATNPERAEKFKQILESNGIPCTIRMRRGIDIQAGCGQLASKQ